MKKKLLILAALVLTLACVLSLGALTVSAEEAEPSVTIAKFNLAFEDNTYLKYAVKFTGVDDAEITADNIGMLYWTDYESGFVPGTEDFSSETTGYTTISGVKHYVFEYTHLAAKQLTDYVYSVAYLEYDGETYYSEPVKYSALEYAYNRLGKTHTGSTNTELKALLNNMLAYGASAQQYFDYKEDRLATKDFHQLTLVGGTLDDGFTSGLYLSTDEVTITAPAELDGKAFSAWQNSVGETVSTDNLAVISNLTANETYTATYTETKTYSEGLEYTSNGGGTCYVRGIGTCTDTDLMIPPTSPEGDSVIGISYYAFSNCTSLTNVTIPDGVKYIFGAAFCVCTSLTNVTIPDSVTSIDGTSFAICRSLTNIEVDERNEYYTSIDGDLYTKDKKTLIQYAIGKEDASFTIPVSVTSVDRFAFSGCSSLTNVTVPDSVTSIGRYAFQDCNKLVSITIGNSVTSVSSSAFYNCIALTDVYYTGTEEEWAAVSIESDNDPLTTATLYYYSETQPTTDGTFWHYVDGVPTAWPAHEHNYSAVTVSPTCTEQGYTTYTCTCGDSYINEIAASGHNFASITVNSPTCTASGYESCMDCSRCGASFYTILDPLGHDYQNGACIVCGDIQLKDGLNFTSNGDGTCYVSGFGTCEDTVIIIPSIYNGETVTGIGAGAFSNQTTITSVTIPETVTSIGNNAFRNCTKVETIYYNAICVDDLDYMNGVFFNVGGANHGFTLVIGKDVTRIPACLFHPTSTYGASEHKIKILRFEAGSVCESIGESAFQYCGLRSVELPKSIKSIEYQAFYANEISNVYYGGSTSDLENVTISCAAINGATIYTYSETTPTTEGNFWHYVDGVPIPW